VTKAEYGGVTDRTLAPQVSDVFHGQLRPLAGVDKRLRQQYRSPVGCCTV
jgi:hypothetical protein